MVCAEPAESAPMARRTAAALAAALITLACVASAAAAPTISEYSLEYKDGQPLGIVAGVDGNLWATQSSGANALDRITPGGAVTLLKTGGTSIPRYIAAGADGSLWYTATGANGQIGTIDPQTDVFHEYSLPPASSPAGITAGPEGNLWFTNDGSAASIGRIVPSSHEITEFSLPNPKSAPAQITVGPEGDIWFTEDEKPGALGRFDPKTKGFSEYSNGLSANSDPWGITTGPEGDIWFTEASSPGRIGRIDPQTFEIKEFSSGITVGSPQAIVTGSDGNLYFTESAGNGALGQITPAGKISEYATNLSPKGEPWGIATGPDGNIWFTEKNNPAKVAKLTVTARPPTLTEGPASEITALGATLNGSVDPQGVATTYHFELGTTTAYGAQLPHPDASAGSGMSARAVSLALSSLSPSTTYHYRLVASSCGGCASGTVAGSDQTFSTSAASVAGNETLSTGLAPVSPLVGPGQTPAPKAVLGRLAAADPISGRVLAEFPSSHEFVALKHDQTVPLGTVLDASAGVVRVVTALPKRGRTQSLRVWGGVFQIRQSRRGTGLTRLILKAPLSCRKHAQAHLAGASTTRAGKSRKLWAKDNHGRYGTYGANSVATVLGTEWETIDTCAGTLTRVVKGKVSVRDLHTHKTVIVSAGHSDLARP